MSTRGTGRDLYSDWGENCPVTSSEHAHGPLDWSVRGEQLIQAGEVTAPMVADALRWVVSRVRDVRSMLDVGSGPGLAACALAQMVPQAQVVAADGAAELLELARQRAARLGVADRLITRQVSLPHGLSDLPAADIVWASEVMHHLPDPAVALRGLGALVRPGGLLALREGGLSARFLPNGVAPGLLARLAAIDEQRAASHDHPAGVWLQHASWPELIRLAGLQYSGSRSFLLDLPAPLPDPVRRYIHGRLATARQFFGEQLDPADQIALDRLLDEDSPDGVLRRADLFLLTVSTIHTAQPA
jgi:SAM-dependent methyltransferase